MDFEKFSATPLSAITYPAIKHLKVANSSKVAVHEPLMGAQRVLGSQLHIQNDMQYIWYQLSAVFFPIYDSLEQ